MSSPAFEAALARYVERAREARDHNQHHDHRRQLFLGFLRDAFGIGSGDVTVEQYIQIAGKRASADGIARVRKGWIDAVFRDLIFEFKRDLKKEEADGLRELRDYLNTLDNGKECVGLLTDGLLFVVYVLDDSQPGGLRQVEREPFNLEKADPETAYRWLDAYLLRQHNQPPTSADIVRRFGLTSPTFVAAARVLREALRTFGSSEAGALEVKRQQWAFYLARVYGSADASNDEMFVRHTYLCQFAKLLAYTARFGVGDASDEVEQILSGKAFEVLGVSNIGEQDFFAWVLAPEVREQTLAVFRQIVGSFIVYDLKRIDEDLLKQLYQNLVEPETRHELGEFYTPDWLAELTLREIGYKHPQSLLDPACGSGAFLFTAIRLLAEQGLAGDRLVEFVLEHVMGMDVHPLAVTIARINYMLAILPHIQERSKKGQRAIPIALANSLLMPSTENRIPVIKVPLDEERAFQIPAQAAQRPHELSEVLSQMGRYAEHAAKLSEAGYADFGRFAQEKLTGAKDEQEASIERSNWAQNARHLTRQIATGRDSIWLYVLQNTSRPLVLQQRKVDVVIGNPPWIAYRYLQDATYQRDVKKLTREYGLLDSKEVKLFTQMDLSTLFFEHCRTVYLKPGGTIAFVLPRSVLTGAKQHKAFQERGFSRVLDLKDVAPLFNVETCVLIRSGETIHKQAIPTRRFAGKLPRHECKLAEARKHLSDSQASTDFARQNGIASPYYHPRVINGATLYPRNLCFVTSAQPDLEPGKPSYTYIMRTDPDVDAEAKAPWKGLKLEGYIDEEFLYATLLSKQLVPFGVRRFHLAALPMRVGLPKGQDLIEGAVSERFIPMTPFEMRESITYAQSANEWFEPAEKLWQKHKKAATKESLAEWLNYQNKITAQSPEPGYLVLYNAAGSNITSAVLDTHDLPIINGARPKAFVLDHTAYWYRASTPEEAHYLSALLNAPCVDAAIKIHQTRGLFGARHIHRRPFEVCPIPPFDAGNAEHLRLAELSQAAHAAVARVDLSEGGVVAARKKARQAAREYLSQIDAIAQQMLGLAPATEAPEDEENGEEEAS
jgi:hypothetical protein